MNKSRYIENKFITTSAGAYSAGDQIGDLLEFSSLFRDGVGVKLTSISLLDKVNQKAEIDVLFFKDEPTVSSTDNSAVNITSSELEKCIGIITLQASDYKTVLAGNNAIATKQDLDLVLQNTRTLSNKKSSLWALCVVRGTPTYTAAANLELKLGVEAN